MTAARRKRQAREAAEHRHWRDRLIGHFRAAPMPIIWEGARWYPQAEEIVAALAEHHDLPRPQIAGILAALSPQQRWRTNVASAVALLGGERAAGYSSNVEKAKRIALGEPALEVIGGDKVTSFWANLYGSRWAITVDTWAQRAATGEMAEQPKGARYRRLQRAYISAADAVGWPPREFQAAVWLAVRPTSEHKRDILKIGELTI
jgi:hypothetical protein